MKARKRLRKYLLRAGSFLLLVAALVTPAPGATVSAALPAASAKLFTVEINPPEAPICVGETRTVAVGWGVNPDPTALAPLSGPTSIYVSANLGSFDRYRTTPLVPSGVSTFEYTAQKEGTERLHAQAMTGEDADAGASVSFQVKKCEYKYTLYAEGNLTNKSSDTNVALRFVIRSEGQLKATNPDQPLKYEALGKEVHEATTVTAWSIPDCTLLTWEPGIGSGFVDVKAERAAGQKAMTLQFAPPRSFQIAHEVRGMCDDQVHSWGEVIPVSTHDDPWIEATFPDGQGVKEIKLDLFARAVETLNRGARTSFSYSARVTLRRVEPK